MPTFKHSRGLRASLLLTTCIDAFRTMNLDVVPFAVADLEFELWMSTQWGADMAEAGFWLPAYADD